MKEDLLDKIRIASPCHVSWESMTGTERARFCSQCNLHVYDFSQLSRKEAVALVSKTQGRVCGRLHRRADGTILTSDCPVGLRAIRRRVARMAGAGLAAVLSFFSVAAAQQPGKDKHASSEIKTVRIQRKVVPGNSALSGTVLDPMEATMPAVAITLINEATKARLIATTNENGEYVFPKLAPGQYSLIFKAAGFKQRRVKGVLVGNSEQITVTTTLDLERYSTVGVIVTMDEFESSQGTLTLRDSFMKRLPM